MRSFADRLPGNSVRRPHGTRHIAYAVAIAATLCILHASASAFPERVHTWVLRDSSVLAPETGLPLFGGDIDELRGYGAERVFTATYTRGAEEIRIIAVRAASAADAFGMFALRCGARTFTGMPGDARLQFHSTLLFAYGPFFCRMTARGGRRAPAPDEYLADAVRKYFYTLADCHPSDFPLPDEERILGRERFLSGMGAWRQERRRIGEGFVQELAGRHAWVGMFRKSRLPFERTLYVVPARDESDAATLFTEVAAELRRWGRPAFNTCGITSCSSGPDVLLVFRLPRAIFIVHTDRGDSGACWWIRDRFADAR